ncbi:hypothetical protein DFH09DRAFT_1376441 [Mycena vulgaris]|nr:hypothetical protein DFH09DRAFT_1376441 [Mycena vulgaris]
MGNSVSTGTSSSSTSPITSDEADSSVGLDDKSGSVDSECRNTTTDSSTLPATGSDWADRVPLTPAASDARDSSGSLDDKSREIYVISRPLHSKGPNTTGGTGDVPSQTPPPTSSHWAVLVGDFVHQLVRVDSGGHGVVHYEIVRFVEGQWSTQYHIGETILTDEQLLATAQSIISQMPQKYRAILNNCHNFVMYFLGDIAHRSISEQKLKPLVTGAHFVARAVGNMVVTYMSPAGVLMGPAGIVGVTLVCGSALRLWATPPGEQEATTYSALKNFARYSSREMVGS